MRIRGCDARERINDQIFFRSRLISGQRTQAAQSDQEKREGIHPHLQREFHRAGQTPQKNRKEKTRRVSEASADPRRPKHKCRGHRKDSRDLLYFQTVPEHSLKEFCIVVIKRRMHILRRSQRDLRRCSLDQLNRESFIAPDVPVENQRKIQERKNCRRQPDQPFFPFLCHVDIILLILPVISSLRQP